MRFFLMLLLINLVSACSIIYDPSPKGWPGWELRPLVGIRGFPPPDTDYGKGFRHGCGNAWDAVAKGLLSDISPKGLDPVMMAHNSDYRVGYSDGFEQCTYIIDWDVV